MSTVDDLSFGGINVGDVFPVFIVGNDNKQCQIPELVIEPGADLSFEQADSFRVSRTISRRLLSADNFHHNSTSFN